MRLLSFIYQRSNFTPTTNHLVNLSFFISNISARFRLILAVYHQTSLKMSHPSGGPCGGKSHPIMPHISCIIPNNYNAGYINPYDVSWDFNGISNLQRSPPTTIRFLAGLLSANNHVKKKSQPSKSWGPPGGLAPLAPHIYPNSLPRCAWPKGQHRNLRKLLTQSQHHAIVARLEIPTTWSHPGMKTGWKSQALEVSSTVRN